MSAVMAFAALLAAACFVSAAQASLFCQYSAVPGDLGGFYTMHIQSQDRDGLAPFYRISDVADTDPSFTNKSGTFRLLTSQNNNQCPGKNCVTELSAAMPKHQGSVLYQTNLVGKLVPPGFTTVPAKQRLYCAVVAGDCGADVPIYRYYNLKSNGFFHAYSTDADISIDGYTREDGPLCYGWPMARPTMNFEDIEGSGEDEDEKPHERETFGMIRDVCDDVTMPTLKTMRKLKVYINDEGGVFRDHYYTTRLPEDARLDEFDGYHLENELGYVVTDEDASNCGCLVRMHQMLDNQDGFGGRKDHKLVIDYLEPPVEAGEKYEALSEEVYCVRQEGACGASIPIRKHFNIFELDTRYTLGDAKAPDFTVPKPSGVLCYIWSKDQVETTFKKKLDAKKNKKAKKNKNKN